MFSSQETVIQTVLGDITPSEAGIILPHEHISMDYRKCFVNDEIENRSPILKQEREQTLTIKPMLKTSCQKDRYLDKNIHLGNLHWIHMHPYSHEFNLNLKGEETKDMLKEVGLFKFEGGGTIVDNTVTGIERDHMKLMEISNKSGIHIVCGTGYYLDHTLTDVVKSESVERLSNVMIEEITQGIENSGIKCGLIGEIGTSWPVTEAEKKSLVAAAIAQSETHAPVMIHPGRNEEAPFETMRIFLEAGGTSNKCCMAHLDRTLFKLDDLLKFSEFGCYLEFDHFGIEISYYQNNPMTDMPNDAQRISLIKDLLKEGQVAQILLSHDIHTRHRLVKYGGHGFAHILQNIVPKMLNRGITQSDLDMMLCLNPKDWLMMPPTN